eukprot:2113054-Alexandrium_andersonii.AAC.1
MSMQQQIGDLQMYVNGMQQMHDMQMNGLQMYVNGMHQVYDLQMNGLHMYVNSMPQRAGWVEGGDAQHYENYINEERER